MPHCAAALISVAEIMPQAMGSGKAHAETAMSRLFPQSGMVTTDAGAPEF
jgi:hypothetical protein